MVPPVSLSPVELRQIDSYRTALRTKKLTVVINDGTGQAQPTTGGGPGSSIGLEGDGSGQRGERGDGGVQGPSASSSEPKGASWASIVRGERDNQAVGAGLENFTINPTSNSPPVLDDFGSGSQGLLILEDVDADAQEEDCTFRDELFLLARSGGPWPETLEKFLQAERTERDEMQKQRAARLDDWRQAVA
jgi:hypothetical protein